MSYIDAGTLETLCAVLEQRCKALSRISSLYASALELIEKGEYEPACDVLESQNSLFEELFKIELPVSERELAGIREMSQAVLSGKAGGRLDEAKRKAAEKTELYFRLLKNCKTLNEKLAFVAAKKKEESERHITAAKNRRLINAGYGKQAGPVKGALVDYKSTK
ncbi:MAG TPA: hypothetical protein GXX22_01665 [Clostridiales bacterium]|nr:hypothetical protein [Clostridiales bacterium]